VDIFNPGVSIRLLFWRSLVQIPPIHRPRK
jgi:hypothetical protein